MHRRLIRASRLLWPFIGRELREQYAGSLLGMFWSLLQPLLCILLYWWVFAAIMQTRFPENSALADTPFIAFLLTALLPWFAFQDGLNRAAGAILNRRDMVRKVHFPVQVFPLAATAAAFVIHALSFLLFVLIFTRWRGGAVTNVYDAADRLVSVRNPLGLVTSNRYDQAGRVVAVVNPRGFVTSNIYDLTGNLAPKATSPHFTLHLAVARAQKTRQCE